MLRAIALRIAVSSAARSAAASRLDGHATTIPPDDPALENEPLKPKPSRERERFQVVEEYAAALREIIKKLSKRLN